MEHSTVIIAVYLHYAFEIKHSFVKRVNHCEKTFTDFQVYNQNGARLTAGGSRVCCYSRSAKHIATYSINF